MDLIKYPSQFGESLKRTPEEVLQDEIIIIPEAESRMQTGALDMCTP
jgi:hypothetical protein